MPQPNHPAAESALYRLGVRVRHAWTMQPPLPEKNLTVFKDAVREEYERTKQAEPPAKPSKDTHEREPGQPDLDR